MKGGFTKFVPFIFMICVLGFIVSKDVSIPSWVTIGIGVMATFVLFVVGFQKPEIPFYVLVSYLPFNKVLSGTFGGFMTALNLTNILIILCVTCWLFNALIQKKAFFVYTHLNWLILAFCLLGVASVVQYSFYYGSGYFMEFMISLKRWLTPVLLYYVSLNIIRNKEILKNTIVIVLIVLTVVGLMTIKEAIDLGDAGSLDSSRVNGIAGQPNMMGAFFVYYMFLFLGFFFVYWHRLLGWSFLIPFLICFRGIQVTFSRGAYVAFAFGLLAITFFKNKFIFFLLCLGIVFVLTNPEVLPGGLQYAVTRTLKGPGVYENPDIASRVDTSSATRIEIWRGALEMIKDNPLTGVGYGVFPFVIPQYVPGVGEMDAHNTYIIIAAEMGIPTLFVFLLIIFLIFKHSLWIYKRCQDPFMKAVGLGMVAGVAGMVVANFFGSRLESEEVSAYFWILAGLIVKAVILKKRKEIA